MATVSNGIAKRLTLGASGQAFSRIASALNTVVLIPTLIHAWGLTGYGEWIALTALASYLSYSNFGLVTTSAYEMIMAIGARDTDRARRAFQMSINLTLYIVFPLIALLWVSVSLLPIARILNLSYVTNSSAIIILGFCALQIWFQTLRGVLGATLYASGSYGFAYCIDGLVSLAELFGTLILVILFRGTQTMIAGLMAVGTLADLLIVIFFARNIAPWARVDLRIMDRSWLMAQARPALGLAFANLANQGVLVQGPRVILSMMWGGQAVALYSVYAAAVRLIDQLLLMLVLPLGIEIGSSIGNAELQRTRQLISLGNQTAALMFVLVAFGLLAFGPFIFRLWTTHQVVFSYGLMSLFLLMSACVQAGRVSYITLVSNNRMYGPSFITLATATFSIALGALLATQLNVAGMVIGNICGEFLNALLFIRTVTELLKVSLMSFLTDMFRADLLVNEVRRQLRRVLW